MSFRQPEYLIYIFLTCRYQQSYRVSWGLESFRRYVMSAINHKMEFNNQKDSEMFHTNISIHKHRKHSQEYRENKTQTSIFSVLQRRQNIGKPNCQNLAALRLQLLPLPTVLFFTQFQLFCAPCSPITKNCTSGNDNFPQEKFLYLKEKGNIRMVVAVIVCPQDYKLHYAVMNFSINVI